MNTIKTLTTIAMLLLFGSLILNSCASEDAPANTTTVTIAAETEGSMASGTFRKNTNSPTAGIVCDSIEITRTRFLLSRVKLHVEGNDTLKDGDIKVGPFVLEFTPGLSRTFSTITIPSGTYEKIKFEIHKFPSSIDQIYLNDPIFTDFVTGERSTVIIEGRVWSAGSSIPVNFVYKSKISANVEAKFPGTITLDAGSTPTIAMIFSPVLAFKATNVLDPRDPDNANEIDKYLKTAIKALKK